MNILIVVYFLNCVFFVQFREIHSFMLTLHSMSIKTRAELIQFTTRLLNDHGQIRIRCVDKTTVQTRACLRKVSCLLTVDQ